MNWFFLLVFLFIIVSVAMILIILVQRPSGGGLAGAFGGAGGGGADTVFGGRVGDALTWATVVAFAAYLIIAITLNLVPPGGAPPADDGAPSLTSGSEGDAEGGIDLSAPIDEGSDPFVPGDAEPDPFAAPPATDPPATDPPAEGGDAAAGG